MTCHDNDCDMSIKTEKCRKDQTLNFVSPSQPDMCNSVVFISKYADRIVKMLISNWSGYNSVVILH